MTNTNNSPEPYILFELGDTTYGVRSRTVQQMEMIEQITPVPNAPAFVEGVVFSRGKVIPAVDLRTRFGLEKKPYNLRTRLVVAQTGDRTIGLIVDTAREFLSIPPDAIQPPPDEIAGLSGNYLEGIATIGKRLILILDIDKVLAPTISLAQESA